VPHFPQKVRRTLGDDLLEAGWPSINVNLSLSKPAHVTKGAPLARRQLWQWQCVMPYAGQKGAVTNRATKAASFNRFHNLSLGAISE